VRRSHIPLLLVLLYGTTLMLPLWPVLDYIVNKEYIAKVLCINRDRPELKCEGKCHLTKMMAEQQSEEQSEAVPVQVLATFAVFPLALAPLRFAASVLDSGSEYLVNSDELPSDLYDGRIFHPPRG